MMNTSYYTDKRLMIILHTYFSHNINVIHKNVFSNLPTSLITS